MSYIKKDTVSVCGESVTVRELVPRQVAEVLDEMKTYKPHVLDLLVERDIPVQVVLLSTGREEEYLMATPVAELEKLYDKVIEVNPSLAALTERLRKALDHLRETPSGPQVVSS